MSKKLTPAMRQALGGPENRNELNDQTYQAKRDYDYERNQLVVAMESLGEHLLREAEILKHSADLNGNQPMPNSLGEVQGSGHEVDRLCAMVHARLALLMTLVKCGGSSVRS